MNFVSRKMPRREQNNCKQLTSQWNDLKTLQAISTAKFVVIHRKIGSRRIVWERLRFFHSEQPGDSRSWESSKEVGIV